MMETTLRISFFSDWHCGSGLGESHRADAILSRDADGIPVLPGRAVKGALREGAWRLCALGGDYVEAEARIFGSPACGDDRQRAGRLFVGPAELPRDIRGHLLSLSCPDRAREVSYMITRRSRTALRDGVARRESLRTLECGIPGLVFTSALSFDVPDEDGIWLLPYMAAVCAAVKSMGGDRARGLGRCLLQLGTAHGHALPDLQSWRMSCARS